MPAPFNSLPIPSRCTQLHSLRRNACLLFLPAGMQYPNCCPDDGIGYGARFCARSQALCRIGAPCPYLVDALPSLDQDGQAIDRRSGAISITLAVPALARIGGRHITIDPLRPPRCTGVESSCAPSGTMPPTIASGRPCGNGDTAETRCCGPPPPPTMTTPADQCAARRAR